MHRESGSVSTVTSKTLRNIHQKGDKGVTKSDGKQQGSRHEECKRGEEYKQGEEFVCPVCLKSANTDVVECGKCQRWHHFTCVSLEEVRHELHDIEWACEACTRADNISDDDVFVDSMGAPARHGEQSSDMVQDSGIPAPQLVVATPAPNICVTGHMDKGCIHAGPENGQERELGHMLHDDSSVLGNTNVCNTHDNAWQPPVEQDARDLQEQRPQEQRSGTSEGNHETRGTTLNSSVEDMLIFATCKDLEANLEARQAGSSVHSNTAAPEPFMTQSSSIEDISIACGAERALEAEGGQQQHNTYKVLIPEDTVGVFLDLAKQNTNQNIETVGILAGNVTSPNIRVTHLVVPRQKGDSTTCECLEEELVVATLQENDVVQVGWIHTHPSHSTFLSSIDVHTQYRLQRDIPEAVAIVHSHRDGQTGYFRLTERGMRDIANCQEDGFHEGCARAENWGTVQTLSATDLVNIKAIDLRKVQNKKGQTEKIEESKQKQDNSQNDCGRAWKATEEMTRKGNSCLAENEQQEGPPQEMGDSSTTEQTSKEDSCLPAQVPQQEVCSVTAKSRQTEENTDDMNKKEQSGNNTGKDQKLKRQRKARADVQMADILAENQALKVEIQQLRTQGM